MARVWLLLGFLLGLGLVACQPPVTVRRVPSQDVYRLDSASVLDTGEPSRFSRIVLQKAALETIWEATPTLAIEALYHRAVRERGSPGRDGAEVLALAELSYLQGRRSGRAADFLGAAVFAYFYLFGLDAPDTDAWDPRTRIAADIYNRALARSFESDRRFDLEGGQRQLPIGTINVRVPETVIRWPDGVEFGRFLPADELEVEGLESRYRRPGLGAPLIAQRTSVKVQGRDFLPRNLAIPATAFLRVGGDLRDLEEGKADAVLELHDPLREQTIDVRGRAVPLEAQTTTAFAYLLGESQVWDFEISGFLGSTKANDAPGLAMVEPYQPRKTPLIFVHGTASSPGRWAGLFNELRNDPRIGDRYQFWFFSYNSGNPIVYSAAQLRESLGAMRSRFDPEGVDPAMADMVLIGHSQGGLLVRLAISDSTRLDLDALGFVLPQPGDASPEDIEFMRKIMLFEPDPGVALAIFLSTPHRGSFVAGGWAGRFGSRLISVSQKIMSVPWNLIVVPASKVAQGENPLTPEPFQLETAVQNMAPDSRFVAVLQNIPMSEGVAKHSIVGVQGKGPAEKGNDGVVAYESAHLAEAVSEVVVRSGHSLQSNPVTVQAVRRILLDHLDTTSHKRGARLGSDGALSRSSDAEGRGSSTKDSLQNRRKD